MTDKINKGKIRRINNMADLEIMVNDLTRKKCKNDIIDQLQKIMKKFLNQYVLIINGHKIEPLWVEAYYKKGELFEDKYNNEERTDIVHCSEFQLDGFGKKLHFHKVNSEKRNGMDICLSNSKSFYLSLLIKYAMVDGVFMSQSKIANSACKFIEKSDGNGGYSSKTSLLEECTNNERTYFTCRVGKNMNENMLACLIRIDNKYRFQVGHAKKYTKGLEINQ